RNVWELALRNWREREAGKAEPNIFPYAQIVGNLAKLEEEEKNYSKAIEYLDLLKQVSPHKDSIQKWIEDIKSKETMEPRPMADSRKPGIVGADVGGSNFQKRGDQSLPTNGAQQSRRDDR